MNVLTPVKMPPTESLGNFRHMVLSLWTFVVEETGEDYIATVPAGFVTDFFSVPLLFSIAVPRDGASNIPALVHDYLYATCGLRELPGDEGLTRKQCDDALYECMANHGFSFWKRNQIYYAVRMGGWIPWNKLRDKQCCVRTPEME